MQEVFARRDVLSPARLRALCRPSDFRGWFQTLSHVGAAGASGALLWRLWGGPWAVPVFIVHGMLLNFLYAGQHELSHWTVFRTAWLNEWLGRIFGFVLFYPRTFDQLQHIAHHRHTQDWARDGELVHARLVCIMDVRFDLLVHAVAAHPALLVRRGHGTLYRGVAARRTDARSTLACGGVSIDRALVGSLSQLGGGDIVAGTDAGHEVRASDAKHHRASRLAARR
jgi:hypothetical protein